MALLAITAEANTKILMFHGLKKAINDLGFMDNGRFNWESFAVYEGEKNFGALTEVLISELKLIKNEINSKIPADYLKESDISLPITDAWLLVLQEKETDDPSLLWMIDGKNDILLVFYFPAEGKGALCPLENDMNFPIRLIVREMYKKYKETHYLCDYIRVSGKDDFRIMDFFIEIVFQ